MSDPCVNISLTFATDTPPATLAATLIALITRQVPDQVISASWNSFDLEDEDDDGTVS